MVSHRFEAAVRIGGVGCRHQVMPASAGIGSEARRWREPRLDDLHLNAERAEFIGERFREALDRVLARRIDCHQRHRRDANARRHIDDRS